MKKSVLPITAVVLFLLGLVRAGADFTHIGPVETLDNGMVTLQVALNVGRIVSYHRTNEKDWLVVVDKAPNPGWNWNPWGGDRVWPSAQLLNYQIYQNNGFDPVIDGKPWQLVSKTADSLVMKSGVSPELGLCITHKIELVKNSSEVVHTYILERLEESRFPVHAWAVTGVRKGEFFFMESDPRIRHAGWKPFRWWLDVSAAAPAASLLPETRFLKVPISEEKLKVGTYGRWVAVVDGNSAFLQSVSYDFKELYLDASNLQAFSSKEIDTYEIETLSPSWFLKKGETREWKVKWKLLDFPAQAATEKDKAVFLQKASE